MKLVSIISLSFLCQAWWLPNLSFAFATNVGSSCPVDKSGFSATTRKVSAVGVNSKRGGNDAEFSLQFPLKATSSADASSSSTTTTDWGAYHLIWSPGAWKKLLIGIGFLVVLDKVSGGSFFLQSCLEWASASKLPFLSLAANVVLPLLASACCLLQLIINLLAGGCAGFNTVLGPVRPYFLSLLLFLTVRTARFTSPRWYGVSALRWSVALLPEALDMWNRYQQQQKSTHFNNNNLSSSTLLEAMTAPVLQATVQLDIPTMGCVACINKIDAALRQAAPGRVKEAVSSLNPLGQKGGYANVQVVAQSQKEMDEILESLVVAVEKSGFEPCQLKSVKIKK